MKCDNVERGNRCGWIGTVGTLHNHLATCQFTPVPCPKRCKNENGEIRSFMRKDLDDHLPECPNREYECEFCGEKGTYATITHMHDEVCEKKVIPCTNIECPDTVQRQELQKHVECECEHTVIACKYKTIGCDVELKRKAMAAHEEDGLYHIHMTIGNVAQLKELCGSLQEKGNRLEEGNSTLREHTNRRCSMLNEQYHSVRTESYRLRRESNTLEEQCRMLQEESTMLRKENNTLKEKCSILNYMLMDESMTFSVTEYQRKKEYETRFISPSFYTGIGGYHVNVDVYANGNGDAKGTHVSVYVHLLEGKYNDKLNWPFVGKVQVMLLNQEEDNHHYKRVVKFESTRNIQAGTALGHHKYISHSDLAVTSYLKDDTLYFRLSFQVADRKPWLECTL